MIILSELLDKAILKEIESNLLKKYYDVNEETAIGIVNKAWDLAEKCLRSEFRAIGVYVNDSHKLESLSIQDK